jgi:ABC-type transporter Mla MlaB component
MPLAAPPQVAPGEHACCVFESDDDQANLLSRFARDAVARRDRIFYLADRSDESKVADILTDAGLDGKTMLDTGALQVLRSSEMGLEDGFDRDRQLAVWKQLTGLARNDGYRGLAVAAEMSWALTWEVDVDALIAYEATSDPVFTTRELSAICQYDARLFDEEVLERAGHAHRYTMSLGEADYAIDYNRLLVYAGDHFELAGEVDLANVQFLQEMLAELLAEGGGELDCSGLRFVDARGCRVLRDAARDHNLILKNIPDALARVMRAFDALEPGR